MRPAADFTELLSTKPWEGNVSSRTWAVTGGVGLLLMAALAGFGNFATIAGLKTAQDITEPEGLFRAGVASLFLVVVLDVVVACALLGYGVGLVFSIPGGLFEVALGVLLIARGFRAGAMETAQTLERYGEHR